MTDTKWLTNPPSNITTNGITIDRKTTAERVALGLTLSVLDEGYYYIYDLDEERPYWWNGTAWV